MICRCVSEPKVVHIDFLRCSSRHLRVDKASGHVALHQSGIPRLYFLVAISRPAFARISMMISDVLSMPISKETFFIPRQTYCVSWPGKTWPRSVSSKSSGLRYLRPLHYCENLEKIVLTVGFSFLRSIVITNKKPD
jgi:hypothetical protein